jgi:hypothetical protein
MTGALTLLLLLLLLLLSLLHTREELFPTLSIGVGFPLTSPV